MTREMFDDSFKQMFESPEMEKTMAAPSTQQRIQKDFEEAFAKVKDKLGDSWQDVRTTYEMAFDKSFTMDRKVKIAVIGGLAYLVSPVDLIPERTLGPLGLADDVAVLCFVLKYAQPEIARYRAFKAGKQDPV